MTTRSVVSRLFRRLTPRASGRDPAVRDDRRAVSASGAGAAVEGRGAVSAAGTETAIADDDERHAISAAETAAAKNVAEAANRFAFDLHRALGADGGNLVFSPASLSLGLASILAAARGETAAQMARTLHVDGLDEALRHEGYRALLRRWTDPVRPDRVPRVAIRIFVERTVPLEPAFVDLALADHGAPVEPIDLRGAPERARAHIDEWVSERTGGRIREIVPPGLIGSDTRFVLANAVCFEGRWLDPFDEHRTRDGPFHLASGKTVSVPLMSRTHDAAYAEHDGVKALRLPCAGGALEMVFLLPAERGRLDRLERLLGARGIDGWIGATRVTEVDMTIPRFKLERAQPFELESTLSDLGMPLVFSSAADLTGMSAERPLSIGSLLHRARVDVDERGTEASAATALFGSWGVAAAPPEFRADHPFLFAIRDVASGMLLFVGRVADPSRPDRCPRP